MPEGMTHKANALFPHPVKAAAASFFQRPSRSLNSCGPTFLLQIIDSHARPQKSKNRIEKSAGRIYGCWAKLAQGFSRRETPGLRPIDMSQRDNGIDK
jgi:hypothetical protein